MCWFCTDLSSRGQTSVRRADPGPAQGRRTRGSPAEDGCRRSEGSAKQRHQSPSAWSQAGRTHVPPRCSQAAGTQRDFIDETFSSSKNKMTALSAGLKRLLTTVISEENPTDATVESSKLMKTYKINRQPVYFEIQVGYLPAVQVLESFQQVSEVERHLLLGQVSPAHYVVKETSLICPESRNQKCISQNVWFMSAVLSLLYSHLQDQDVAAGRLIRVQKFDQVGVVQGLQEPDLLQYLLPTQQLLVDVFGCDGAFAASLVTPLSHWEPAPAEWRGEFPSHWMLTQQSHFFLLSRFPLGFF